MKSMLSRMVSLAGTLIFGAGIACGGTAAELTLVDVFGNNPGNLVMQKYVPDELMLGGPLVVALHGCHQNAEAYYRNTGWAELADTLNFALLLPEQQGDNNPYLCFNWFNGFGGPDWPIWIGSDIDRGQGEAASIKSMIDNMLVTHSVDPRRVFITGLSGGGAMTAVMLSAYPDVFAGGAIIAGVPYKCTTLSWEALSSCGVDYVYKQGQGYMKSLTSGEWGDKVRFENPNYRGSWPRVSIWHGTEDKTVNLSDADELEKQWRDVLGLNNTIPIVETVTNRQYPHKIYKDHQGHTQLEVYKITDMGHGTPIASQPSTEKCGTPSPYILDAGICSSRRIARFWGL